MGCMWDEYANTATWASLLGACVEEERLHCSELNFRPNDPEACVEEERLHCSEFPAPDTRRSNSQPIFGLIFAMRLVGVEL
jgi:hypothetical protein